MKENASELVEKSVKFPCIKKYYGPHLNKLKEKHPLICHLKFNYYLFEFSLNRMNTMLKKLDGWADINKIVRDSKNPPQFFAALSELKVAATIIDRVRYIKKLSSKDRSPTPDFEIQIDDQVITLEVKRIGDKRGNPLEKENRLNDSQYAQEIDDIKKIIGDAEESILKGHQYRKGTPHILILDCGTLMGSDEFEDSFDLQQNEPEFIYRKHGNKEKKVKNEKLFNEIDDSGKYIYSCLSGIIGIFDFQSISMNPENDKVVITKPHWVFYENPHADRTIQIKKKVLDKLKIKIFNEKIAN